MNIPSNPPPLPGQHKSDSSWERSVLEQLAFASLREQRTARRWKIGFRLAWLAYALLLVWALMQRPSATEVKTPGVLEPHTAVVEVQGMIADGFDANAKDIVKNAKAAFESSNAQAVVLLVNSPGGSPVQSGIIADELVRLKKLHNKPLYAVVGDTCASGAYYIAVAADKIFVDKASLVGSIGVRMDGFGFTGTMEKLGVERRLLTAGENKGLLDPFSPADPEQQAHVQTMLNQIHQQFIDVVRKNRGERLKETPEMFSGLIWTGQQAVDMGLADQLGSLGSVTRDVIKQEKIVDYTRRDNFAERLFKQFGTSVGAGVADRLQSQWTVQTPR
ncbi:MAG: signal peptide peptidase SppA [Brachymonas sp.]|nr:signal peptide peptidase SppA [Brachymonas sp.]